MRIALPTLIAAVCLIAAGCGSDPKPPCIGVIQKLYTEQIAPTTVIVGGNNGSGGIGLPVGGGTKYEFYIKREDGSTCSRRVNKNTWLNKEKGDHYTYVGRKSS